MEATEARKITELNQLSLSKAIEMIKESAERGDSMILFSNLHDDSMHRLIQKGYKISKVTDPMGFVVTRVEW